MVMASVHITLQADHERLPSEIDTTRGGLAYYLGQYAWGGGYMRARTCAGT